MDSLRGQLLIAAPALVDPNFHRTVVLVGEHGADGAMGLVLNRPSAATVHDAVPPLAPLFHESDVVHVGGPVQPQAIVVLGEFEDLERAGALVMGSIGFFPGEISEPEDVGEIGRARVFAGYAGWAPGQLEQELDEEAWILEPALPSDVFTDDHGGLWSTVLRRKGGPYGVLSLLPEDPSVN